MIVKDSAGRSVEIQVSGSDMDDIMIDSADYVDSDQEVPEEEIEYIYNAYAGEIEEEFIQNAVMKSEAYYEGDR